MQDNQSSEPLVAPSSAEQQYQPLHNNEAKDGIVRQRQAAHSVSVELDEEQPGAKDVDAFSKKYVQPYEKTTTALRIVDRNLVERVGFPAALAGMIYYRDRFLASQAKLGEYDPDNTGWKALVGGMVSYALFNLGRGVQRYTKASVNLSNALENTPQAIAAPVTPLLQKKESKGEGTAILSPLVKQYLKSHKAHRNQAWADLASLGTILGINASALLYALDEPHYGLASALFATGTFAFRSKQLGNVGEKEHQAITGSEYKAPMSKAQKAALVTGTVLTITGVAMLFTVLALLEDALKNESKNPHAILTFISLAVVLVGLAITSTIPSLQGADAKEAAVETKAKGVQLNRSSWWGHSCRQDVKNLASSAALTFSSAANTVALATGNLWALLPAAVTLGNVADVASSFFYNDMAEKTNRISDPAARIVDAEVVDQNGKVDQLQGVRKSHS